VRKVAAKSEKGGWFLRLYNHLSPGFMLPFCRTDAFYELFRCLVQAVLMPCIYGKRLSVRALQGIPITCKRYLRQPLWCRIGVG
jgi:hypothetical protein